MATPTEGTIKMVIDDLSASAWEEIMSTQISNGPIQTETEFNFNTLKELMDRYEPKPPPDVLVQFGDKTYRVDGKFYEETMTLKLRTDPMVYVQPQTQQELAPPPEVCHCVATRTTVQSGNICTVCHKKKILPEVKSKDDREK